MLYNTYGKTGKRVSAVSFGGMRFRNPEDIDANAELIVYAHEKGINYFDTAPGYCGDKSEEIVGAAVRQLEPGTFYVSTKCGASDGDSVRRSIERSIERLGVERIHFFHIWCVVTLAQWEQRKQGGAVAAAFKAKEEGLVEHVVWSTHLRGAEIAAVIRENIFEGVTLGYCAINFPFREEGLKAARQAGIGVVTMNPLGGGIIPQNAGRFDFIRTPDDPDTVTAALRFNISNPAVTTALVGFSDREQIDLAVRAVEDFQPHPEEHLETLKKQIEDSFNELCTGCGYCMPCPHEVDIPKLMDAYNHRVLSGKDQALLNRLKWHWGLPAKSAADCVACGQCEELCTQRLPIIDRLREVAAIAENE